MPALRTSLVALAMLALAAPGVRAQGVVAFAPIPGVIPDGATMSVTPVVSADRRYVRMSLAPQFVGFVEFQTFPVPAAVGGGPGGPGALGGVPGIPGGGAAIPGGGVLAGMNGVIGPVNPAALPDGSGAGYGPSGGRFLNRFPGLAPAPTPPARAIRPAAPLTRSARRKAARDKAAAARAEAHASPTGGSEDR